MQLCKRVVMQKNKYAIMQTCSFTGIHLDDKIQKAKKREMFFCILSTTDDKNCKRGFSSNNYTFLQKLQVFLRMAWMRKIRLTT